MRYFKIKTSEQSLYSQYENGENELTINHLIQYEKDIEIGAPVFLMFGGDGTPWKNGLYGIAQIVSGKIDVGYEESKIGTYYRLKINVKIRLSNVYEKKDFYLYPDTMDSGIGPSTKGERNQALGLLDEKAAKAVCRAILEKEPEKRSDFEKIFGTEFMEEVETCVDVMVK